MAVITIAVCDEVRKDAQKLVKKLSELIPEAELLVYRKRESLLKGRKMNIRDVMSCLWDWTEKREKVWRPYVP